MASPFDFGLEHKNIILVALLDFEFSHSLGQGPTLRSYFPCIQSPHFTCGPTA